MQIDAMLENGSMCIYCEPTRSILWSQKANGQYYPQVDQINFIRQDVSHCWNAQVCAYQVPFGSQKKALWGPTHNRHDSVPSSFPHFTLTWTHWTLVELPCSVEYILMQSILFKPNLYFISQPCHLTQAHQERFKGSI